MRSHVEKSKKYELDKFLIKKIYNIKEKKERVYKLQKKNVVYDKQITEQYYKYSNNNRNNYYSCYQSFRDYISSGYNYEFLVNEINNVKSILGFSRNIREIINKKITQEMSNHNISSSSYSNQNQIIELNEESNSNEKINIHNEKTQNFNLKKNIFAKQSSDTFIKRASTVFQIDRDNPNIKKISDLKHKNISISPTFQSNMKKPQGKKDFLEICKLLKIKEEEARNPQNQYQFRLFSVLSEDFDPFCLPENFMHVKYDKQKTKLVKLYNQEIAFIECVTLIKNKLKSHLKKNKNNKDNTENNESPALIQNTKNENDLNFHNLSQYKFQKKIPYINAFFFGRTEAYFKKIDNFMSMYKENISLESKQLEKDFFANLFKILTFNNTDGKKFLQYLYSHSYFFHYIYNIFTVQNKITGNTIKNFAPLIKKYNGEDPFLNDSMKQLFLTDDSKNKSGEDNKLIINKEQSENIKIDDEDLNFDNLLGNEFIYKIKLCEEDISDHINTKKIHHIKRAISNHKNYNPNYILTLNNQNILQIININHNMQNKEKKSKSILKNKKNYYSFPFDENLLIYDLENDIKKVFRLDKEVKKNDKLILIGIKDENFTKAYICKLTKNIFARFTKSIFLKGKRLKKNLILGGEEENEEKSDEKLQVEDIMNEANELKKRTEEEIFDFDSNDKDSEKNKKEKDSIEKQNSKQKIRRDNKMLTFGGAFINVKKDNLNESDKNEENEDDEENKSEKSDNKDSSDEAKSKLDLSEEEENEEGDGEGEEDEDDEGDEENENDNDNDNNENEGNKENDDTNEEKENDKSGKDDNNENKDDEKIDESNDKNSDEESEVIVKNLNNEEEINTDINKGNKNDKSEDEKDLSHKDGDNSSFNN